MNVGNSSALVRVGHTRDLPHWEGKPVQHLVHKPVLTKQKFMHQYKVGMYRTVDLNAWKDAYHCLDQCRFVKKALCTLLEA